MRRSAAVIEAQIAKGIFRPHTMLTNMAVAYFQDAKNYAAKSIFPICPVELSSDIFYKFSKEDLLRDNWKRKPQYGKVNPSQVSENTGTYNCLVDQNIMGIDQIKRTDDKRRQGPALKDPRIQRTKTMAEQANIHQDRLFAEAYFKSGVWTNEFTGNDDGSGDKGFIQFSNDNSEPIKFIKERKKEMKENTGRVPNVMGLGVNVFNTLTEHPAIVERVKYSGSTANPAIVTENVLAQLFGVDKIVTFEAIHNKAKLGQKEDMSFICDPNSFLLAYATSTPSVEEPSAGYIFTWDMLGDGQFMPTLNYDGEPGTHTEYVEMLMATDMKKVCDDLGMFFNNAVSE